MHNHFLLLDKFRKYKATIQDLLASITTSLDVESLIMDPEAQRKSLVKISKAYPFIELMYSLDAQGVQRYDTIYSQNVTAAPQRYMGKGSDRSHRPYFLAAQSSSTRTVVTEPYLSSATHKLSLSSVQHIVTTSGEDRGYLVINFNLARLVSYLLGDERRGRLHPLFQGVYTIIGICLIGVSLWLLAGAFYTLKEGFSLDHSATNASFGIVVMLTLSLAVFDLGKTILEEEVLMSKDINHYRSSRRTIMRFMAAIIIAVSIEALLLMFKSVLSSNMQNVIYGVWMLLSAVGLLAGLGVYLKLSREEEK